MRILHPTDFSTTAELALVIARDLRARSSGELHLVHVQERYSSGMSRPFGQPQLDTVNPELAKRAQADRQAESDRIRSMLTHLGSPDATVELRWGQTLRELLDMAPDFDIIVMGAHGSERLDEVFLGGIANRVVRRSPVPVITVRQESRTKRVQRVLVGTDFSETSRHAVQFCLDLRQHGVSVVLAHVMDNSRLQDDAEATQRITAELDRIAPGDIERRVLREGDPVRELPTLAEEVGADVIAIGVKHPERGRAFLLGRRADGLIRSSPTPILSVPHWPA